MYVPTPKHILILLSLSLVLALSLFGYIHIFDDRISVSDTNNGTSDICSDVQDRVYSSVEGVTAHQRIMSLMDFIRGNFEVPYDCDNIRDMDLPYYECEMNCTQIKDALDIGIGCCGHMSRTMATLSKYLGHPSRIVHLKGREPRHVVVEVFYNESWHMYDPYYGRYFTGNGTVLSVIELSRNMSIIDEFYMSNIKNRTVLNEREYTDFALSVEEYEDEAFADLYRNFSVSGNVNIVNGTIDWDWCNKFHCDKDGCVTGDNNTIY